MSKNWCIVRIENGEIVNKKVVRQLFEQLNNGRYQVQLIPADKRTLPQNKYYWALVVPMVQKAIEDLGTDVTIAETHELLKSKFNTKELINEATGEFINIPLSTTSLNKEQFSEYLEKIQRFSAEFLNIIIPDPGQQMALYE